MDTIQSIFIISRKRDTERLQRVKQQLDTLLTPTSFKIPVIHFEAIEPDFSDPILAAFRDRFKLGTWSWVRKASPERQESYQRGAIGCMLSHIHVCTAALNNGLQRIMVLEDDVVFSRDFVGEVNDAIYFLDNSREIGGRWDLLYLESTEPISLRTSTAHEVVYRDAEKKPRLLQTFGNLNTAAMILNKTAMTEITTKVAECLMEIDVYLGLNYSPTHRVYMLPEPLGAKQASFTSTIDDTRKGFDWPPLYDPSTMVARKRYARNVRNTGRSSLIPNANFAN